MTTFIDGLAAVKLWVNSQTATLVGPGNPLPLGAVLKQGGVQGAADSTYGFIFELPASTWGGAENASMRSRISMQIYGPTKESACDGAIAYADAVQSLINGARVTLSGGVTLLGADDLVGPSWLPDGDEPRYVVDADYLFN